MLVFENDLNLYAVYYLPSPLQTSLTLHFTRLWEQTETKQCLNLNKLRFRDGDNGTERILQRKFTRTMDNHHYHNEVTNEINKI